jgi:hypothetical protein
VYQTFQFYTHWEKKVQRMVNPVDGWIFVARKTKEEHISSPWSHFIACYPHGRRRQAVATLGLKEWHTRFPFTTLAVCRLPDHLHCI